MRIRVVDVYKISIILINVGLYSHMKKMCVCTDHLIMFIRANKRVETFFSKFYKNNFYRYK